MVFQRNNFLWFKVNALARYIMKHSFSNLLPLYIVNEYPKSGGSWVGEMLSNCLEIPFPRNRLPVFRESILHGHMMHSWNMHNKLIVWRDGRDVLVSQYYHYLFENGRGNTNLVRKNRKYLSFKDYNDIKTNLIPFMDYIFQKPIHPRFTWKEFVNKWNQHEDCVHVKYECLKANPNLELARLAFALSGKRISESRISSIVEKHSFQNQTGRKPGDQNIKSFLRKGIVGDWKNHFTSESKKQFHDYAGQELIDLEYENDDNWVREKNLTDW